MAAAHDWRRSAACLAHDPELFFPIGTARPAVRQLDQAREVCRGCPVRMECLEWAIDVGVDDGIWGGLSEDERRRLRRRRRSGRSAESDRVDAVAASSSNASRQRTLNATRALPGPLST